MPRNLSVDLSPPVLHDEGLASALRWLAVQMEQQQRLVITVVAAESLPPINNDLRVLLFQFVRELLFNVVKHANVLSAVVALTYEEGHIRIEVSDQGQGFDVNIQSDHIPSDHNSQGLRRVMQRLQPIDGHIHIDSSPNNGTRVTLSVPLHKQNEGESSSAPTL